MPDWLQDAWHEFVQVFRKSPLRTILTAAGVFWGMLMLLLMQGFGNGMEEGVRQSMGDNVTNSVYVWGRNTSLPFHGNRPGRDIVLKRADATALASLEGVEHVAPRLQLGGYRSGTTIKRGEQVGSFQVMGDVPDFAHIQPMIMVEGRFINPIDMEQHRKVVVIGEQIYAELFEAGTNAVGQHLTVGGIDFLVVGRLRSMAAGDDGDRIESRLHVPFTTFQRAFHTGDEVGWFAITGSPSTPGATLEQSARSLLAERHNVHPDDKLAFGSYNAQQEVEQMQALFGGMRLLVWFVGTMTLLSGIVGVSNVMLISVAERTKEIGVRRAIGARRIDVIWMIVREALLLTTTAGYAGLLCGLAIVSALDTVVGDSSDVIHHPSVHPSTVVLAAVLLTLAGVLSGLLPAWRAANVHPVNALRAE